MEGYSFSDGDQLRVSDYIALDVRRALTASVDANNVLTSSVPVNATTGFRIGNAATRSSGGVETSSGAPPTTAGAAMSLGWCRSACP